MVPRWFGTPPGMSASHCRPPRLPPPPRAHPLPAGVPLGPRGDPGPAPRSPAVTAVGRSRAGAAGCPQMHSPSAVSPLPAPQPPPAGRALPRPLSSGGRSRQMAPGPPPRSRPDARRSRQHGPALPPPRWALSAGSGGRPAGRQPPGQAYPLPGFACEPPPPPLPTPWPGSPPGPAWLPGACWGLRSRSGRWARSRTALRDPS